jgi:Protein of unknown function (DUF3761)
MRRQRHTPINFERHDMKTRFAAILITALSVSLGCLAAAPAEAPAGSTGLCKDGTYYSGAEKKGACRGHKGVKEWYADAASGKNEKAKTDTKAPAPKEAAAPAKTKEVVAKPAAVPAPGGGPGMVWANDTTKVYHCAGDRWYGKTKHGEYLSEADAKAKGFKPDHGKACQ